MNWSAGKSQSFTSTVSGSINITSIQSLTFTGGSAIPSFNTISDYFNGVTMGSYLTIAVKSNVNWTLSVNAQNSYFTPMSSGGSTNMPASVLSLKASTSPVYLNMGTNSQTIKTGGRGSALTAGNTFNVDMKFNPGFGFKGGIYTIGLMYTLTQQ